jgi:hypothetical protein
MEEIRNAYVILVGKREGKRPLGIPRRVWENNIRMDLKEIRGCIQKLPDWPPGTRTANGTSLCH